MQAYPDGMVIELLAVQKNLLEPLQATAAGWSMKHSDDVQVQVLFVSTVLLQLEEQPEEATCFSTTHFGLPFKPALKTIFTPCAASEESSYKITVPVTVTGLLKVITESKWPSSQLV